MEVPAALFSLFDGEELICERSLFRPGDMHTPACARDLMNRRRCSEAEPESNGEHTNDSLYESRVRYRFVGDICTKTS